MERRPINPWSWPIKLGFDQAELIEGYLAGPNGEAGGMDVPSTEDVYAYMDALAESVDCIVLGRKTAAGFIPAWASRPEDEPEELIDWINNTPKVVISNTRAVT